MSRTIVTLILLTGLNISCMSQTSETSVGGRCEGCEAVFEYGSKKLTSVDTLPDFSDNGPKIEVTGTVYKKDGKTPASDVILYVYHTDQTGIYPTKGNENGWAKRHGYIRGWVKTGSDGKYTFYTLRPGAYPGGENPEHIHITVKEPGLTPYYIDDFHFDDDPILTDEMRKSQRNRGGNGIISLVKGKNGLAIAKRDIVLGQNVPGY